MTGAHRLAVALAASAALALAPAAAPAGAQLDFRSCEGGRLECAHLAVPLDPATPAAGGVWLAVHRRMAGRTPSATALIALAGGPGQAALPLTEAILEGLGPAASAYDVIVFDQRGTGYSGPLSCHAFEIAQDFSSAAALIGACAAQLGPQRSLYTSAASAADIEALRAASGYARIVLVGTSYGTKVAELYARAHPDRVQALVLDSPVAPEGPEPLARPTFAAIRGVLAAACSRRACAGVTRTPVGDLAHALRLARAGRLRGRAYGPHGERREVALPARAILQMLIAADFAPGLRTQLLSADAAAARGDMAPAARLAEILGEAAGEAEDLDGPLYYATSCEEQEFPWSRDAAPAVRLAEARAAARASARAFEPFSPAEALALGDAGPCAAWPYRAGSSAPAPLGVAPSVPTLVLSGGQDVRTPTAEARRVAAMIPGAHLLVAPDSGHAVLENDQSGCALRALEQLLDAAAGSCRPPARAVAPPPPLPPLNLGALAPAGGRGDRIGRTIAAFSATLADLGHTLGFALTVGSGQGGVGGLRGGYASVSGARVSLHRYTYVPGVQLSGWLAGGAGRLRISGGGSSGGVLASSGHGGWAGTLGGVAVRLPASALAAAGIVGADAKVRARPAFFGARSRRGGADAGAPGQRPRRDRVPAVPG